MFAVHAESAKTANIYTLKILYIHYIEQCMHLDYTSVLPCMSFDKRIAIFEFENF